MADTTVELRMTPKGGSYWCWVTLPGQEPEKLRHCVRWKRGSQARYDFSLEQMRSAHRPTGVDADRLACWQAAWEQVRAVWDREHNSSRTTGLAIARESSSRWNGSVSLADLTRYGCSELGNVGEKHDILEETEVLDRYVASAPKTSVVHGFLYKGHAHGERLAYPPGSGDGVATELPEAEAAALTKVVEAVRKEVGKEVGHVWVEAISSELQPVRAGAQPKAKPCEPPPWHGDHRRVVEHATEDTATVYGDATLPNLTVLYVLSPQAAPTLFPSREYAMSTTPGSGIKPVGEEAMKAMENESFYAGREHRWRLVRDADDNFGAKLLATSPNGASVGVTPQGKARAYPARGGAFQSELRGPRALLERGHALASDATGPHRGPGVVRGEPPRRVLYISFASESRTWEGAAPVFASAKGLTGGQEGVDYHLAFDADGGYLLGSKPLGRPSTLPGVGVKRARSDPRMPRLARAAGGEGEDGMDEVEGGEMVEEVEEEEDEEEEEEEVEVEVEGEEESVEKRMEAQREERQKRAERRTGLVTDRREADAADQLVALGGAAAPTTD